jgi:hypothetical protein
LSGKNNQTYSVQRISKQPKGTGSGRERPDYPVTVLVSERLVRKIRSVSVKIRLPEQIVAGEAIARGFALLKS